MDGLECSEIRMSDVCDTTTLRFDSDYYKKEYLEIEQFICKNRDKFVTIESQGLQVDASAFYPSLEPYYNTGTIPFVRVADVKSKLFKLRIWCRTQTAFPDADNQLPSKYRRWKRDDLSR